MARTVYPTSTCCALLLATIVCRERRRTTRGTSGCYGDRIVRTPTLDTLARRGIVFDRYYVTTPVCMCNRATIMTGRMASLHGGRHNGIPLSRDDVTFVDLLRAAGYRTGLVGKSHLQNMTGNPPVLRYEPKKGLFTPPNDLREARRTRRAGPLYEDENPFYWRERIPLTRFIARITDSTLQEFVPITRTRFPLLRALAA